MSRLTDRALGIKTSGNVRIRGQTRLGPAQKHAEDYQPTPPEVLADMLEWLGLGYPDFTFIDLGAGKGRVVCLASRYHFKKIIGVELVPELAAQAQNNWNTFCAQGHDWQRCQNAHIVTEDVAGYLFPQDNLVLYLFNPFDAPIMRALIHNLEQTLQTHPRQVWVLYYRPQHKQLWERSSAFKRHWEADLWAIFSTQR